MTHGSKETPHAAGVTTRERSLSGQIFSVSAGLVGVCLTVVGIFHILKTQGTAQSLADNLVALDAIVFLSSCVSAYLALRSTSERRWRRLERCADALFLVGLAFMVVISGLIAYELV
jgi:hypothetical protein